MIDFGPKAAFFSLIRIQAAIAKMQKRALYRVLA
jgi:hypothetical protein